MVRRFFLDAHERRMEADVVDYLVLSFRTTLRAVVLGLVLPSLSACGKDDDGGAAAGGGPPGNGSVEPRVEDDPSILPIVFVHGFAGSASQFDSQAQRFVANGFPPDKLSAYEHDGAGLDVMGFVAGLDAHVGGVLQQFGVQQVILIAHSRGTLVSSTYVSDPARAAKVAKLVLLDGLPCSGIPSTIPCTAPNQAGLPGQSHVTVATSAESFVWQYEFLFDKKPNVVEIVKQSAPVEIAGRAVNFPSNTGREGRTLEIFELEPASGKPVGPALASVLLPQSGDWGPIVVDPDQLYELRLSSEREGSYQHFYFQRFLRSTKFIRLLSGPPDSPARANTNAGPNHAALTFVRMREWYGPDDPSKPADVLALHLETPRGTVDVPDAIAAAVKADKISIHLHDDAATPGMTTLSPLPYFATQPFQTGFDVFLPAADPPDGTITITNVQRGDATKPQVVRVPNWSSDKHSIMVMYADFAQ
jgi:pimeloyl-ACP methyl ester carboxylesterase